MNREDILKKAQSAKPNHPDEMELQILQAGSRFGMGVGMLVCVVLMFVNRPLDIGSPTSSRRLSLWHAVLNPAVLWEC